MEGMTDIRSSSRTMLALESLPEATIAFFFNQAVSTTSDEPAKDFEVMRIVLETALFSFSPLAEGFGSARKCHAGDTVAELMARFIGMDGIRAARDVIRTYRRTQVAIKGSASLADMNQSSQSPVSPKWIVWRPLSAIS